MSATLHVISEETRTPKAREERLQRDVQRAYAALDARLAVNPDAKVLKDLSEACQGAEISQIAYWEQRARLAERSLRRVLDGEISAEVRAYVTAAVDGKSQRLIPTQAWTNADYRLVDAYHRFNSADRQMIRRLFERLAPSATEAEGT
jgi:hypothetical protein